MLTHAASPLGRALDAFIAAYHARPDLVAEQQAWRCVITLVASDSGESLIVRIADGRVTEALAHDESARVVITADQQILCDVLELRRGPNEPYLFGELTVRGLEADFFRLDYITSRLCPS
jgi:hypothetical protein